MDSCFCTGRVQGLASERTRPVTSSWARLREPMGALADALRVTDKGQLQSNERVLERAINGKHERASGRVSASERKTCPLDNTLTGFGSARSKPGRISINDNTNIIESINSLSGSNKFRSFSACSIRGLHGANEKLELCKRKENSSSSFVNKKVQLYSVYLKKLSIGVHNIHF